MHIHNFFLIFMTNVLTIKPFNFSLLSLPELDVFNAGSLKALRAARVLRPLKLVSGIPSKLTKYVNMFTVRLILSFHVQSQWWNMKCSSTIMDKRVGTVVQFEHFWTHTKLYPCAINTACPYPLPHPVDSDETINVQFLWSFNIVLGGKGGGDMDL